MQGDDLAPVGRAVSGASLCTAWIAACTWYGPRPVPAQAPPHEVAALGDEVAGPSARGPGRRAARGARRAPVRAGRRDSASSISASRPSTSGSSGISSASRRPSRIASAHEVVAAPPVACALGEDQVDDGQHGGQPVGQVGVVRAPGRGCARPGSCSWRARSAAPSSPRGRGTRARSPAVVRPPSRRRVSATRADRASAGWQQVKIRRRRSSRTGPPPPIVRRSCRLSGRQRLAGRARLLVPADGLAAQPVERPVAARW